MTVYLCGTGRDPGIGGGGGYMRWSDCAPAAAWRHAQEYVPAAS